jgi:hypothetical protein
LAACELDRHLLHLPQTATMTGKHILASVIILLVVVFCACKKSTNNTTAVATTTIADIDSLTGHYAGTTSFDSIYTYTDSTGNTQQWVHSAVWPDTLLVTANDTASVTVTSKFYTVTLPYGDSLTFDYITNLQTTTGQNGYLTYSATLIDTTYVLSALALDHMVVNLGYGYNKYYHSNATLYSRP